MLLKLHNIIFLINIIYNNFAQSKLNIFLDGAEVHRLLGLKSEIFYIRNGTVNENALNRVLIIPPTLNIIHFTWEGLDSTYPILYKKYIKLSNEKVILPLKTNMSESGIIPSSKETVAIELICSEHRDDEETILEFSLDLKMNRHIDNYTRITIRRKKLCPLDLQKISNEISHPSVEVESLNYSQLKIFYIVLCLGCSLITMLVICFLAYIVTNRKDNRRDRLNSEQQMQLRSAESENAPFILSGSTVKTGTSTSSNISHNSMKKSNTYIQLDTRSLDLHDRISEITIERKRIRLQKVELEGTFGRVFNGTYTKDDGTEENVIVKTVMDFACPTQISLLLREGLTMYRLKHKNIMSVIGISIEDHVEPFVIYLKEGYTNLKKFLQKCKFCPEGIGHSLTTQEVVQIALQIISGIQYMHRKKILHKDLATRNCSNQKINEDFSKTSEKDINKISGSNESVKLLTKNFSVSKKQSFNVSNVTHLSKDISNKNKEKSFSKPKKKSLNSNKQKVLEQSKQFENEVESTRVTEIPTVTPQLSNTLSSEQLLSTLEPIQLTSTITNKSGEKRDTEPIATDDEIPSTLKESDKKNDAETIATTDEETPSTLKEAEKKNDAETIATTDEETPSTLKEAEKKNDAETIATTDEETPSTLKEAEKKNDAETIATTDEKTPSTLKESTPETFDEKSAKDKIDQPSSMKNLELRQKNSANLDQNSVKKNKSVISKSGNTIKSKTEIKRTPFSQPLSFTSEINDPSLQDYERSELMIHEKQLEKAWRSLDSRLLKTLPTPMKPPIYLKHPPTIIFEKTRTSELRKSYIMQKIEHVKKKLLMKDPATLVYIKPKMNRCQIIDGSLNVKVADNALSRDLFPNDYHCLGDNENRPVKWLSFESLVYKTFSTASDVWSFGVTLWELTTLAQQPYAEVDPFEIEHYLKDGYRLSQPINCPDELFAVMAYCWAMSPDERPTFFQLLTCLQDFHDQLNRYV
ncbi:hypothetical protein PGB90_002265 [Kerria lacca]